MGYLLGLSDVPDGFSYPASFVRVVEFGLVDLEPWQFWRTYCMPGTQGLAARYPGR